MRDSSERQYRHALVAGFDVSGWTYRMMSDLTDGLRSLGYRAWFIMSKFGEPDCQGRILQAILRLMHDCPDSFVLIDMNHRLILDPWRGELPRRFSFIVDNPLTHYEGLNKSREGTTLGLLDEHHLDIVRGMGTDCDAVFFPHAGPARKHTAIPGHEREIDVLFAGNIGYSPEPGTWREMLSANTDAVREIALNTIDHIVEGTSDPFTAFVSQCAIHGIDPVAAFPQDALAQLFRFAENCAESYLRCRYLSQLGNANMNVHVAGEVPDEVKNRIGCDFVYHGYLDFDACTALMQRSRLVLNVCPKHAGGSHERIWYGMAQGCAVATTPSSYLDRWYENGRDIIYTNTCGWVERIDSLLGHSRGFDQFVDRAGLIYDRHHTWDTRVEIIDRQLNGTANTPVPPLQVSAPEHSPGE